MVWKQTISSLILILNQLHQQNAYKVSTARLYDTANRDASLTLTAKAKGVLRLFVETAFAMYTTEPHKQLILLLIYFKLSIKYKTHLAASCASPPI